MRGTSAVLYTLLAGSALAALGVLVFRSGRSTPSDHSRRGRMRVVSLAPSATEMLFSLGAEESVVAVTEYCDYPPGAKQIERIGGFGKPNIERLLALSPDLVVTAGLERNDVVRTLRNSGLRVLEVGTIQSIAEVFEALRQIGRATATPQRAEEVVAVMEAELKAVAGQSAKTSRGPPPRVFVELWDDPLTTVGRTSFLDDVISRAGGVNVARELSQQHPRVSPEKVIEWNPDVVVVAHMRRGGDAAAQMRERIGWSEIAAVRNGRIVCDIPPDLILRPGPRLIEGVKALAQRLRDAPPDASSVRNEEVRTWP